MSWLKGILLVVFLKALKISNYGSEPLLQNCGISISNGFTQVEGRVLPAPRVYIFIYVCIFISFVLMTFPVHSNIVVSFHFAFKANNFLKFNKTDMVVLMFGK